ncbi:MAG: hypothetical protein PHE48_01590 [Candidatus Daviesbacteria bacterium]|nr:hypothetical protein [Candidatus Daviesbacteria bacterium]
MATEAAEAGDSLRESVGLSLVLPRGNPVTRIHNGIFYETHRVTPNNMWALRFRALPFEKQLGYDSFRTHDEIRHHIQPRPGRLVEVEFARIRYKGEMVDIGVVTQEIADISVDGQKKRGLSIGVKVVDPKFENRDIGTQLLIDALLEHDGIDFVTGRSRNGRVYRYLEKSFLIEKTFPLDGEFTPEIVEALRQILDITNFKQIADLRIGLCVGIYPLADSALFIAPKNNPAAERIVNRLTELGVEPGGLNGLRYYAVVDKEAVMTARDKYAGNEILESTPRLSSLGTLRDKIVSLFPCRH